MDSITLQNYRCFGSEEQTARLAPLTLLVGPNSTGKTSFLALIRALWDVAFREVVPNFREEPFDLGSFEDIVLRPGARGGTIESFRAAFRFAMPTDPFDETIGFESTFCQRSAAPFPSIRRFSTNDAELELHLNLSDGFDGARYRSGLEDWRDFEPFLDIWNRNGLVTREMLFPVTVSGVDGDLSNVRHLLWMFDLVGTQAGRPFAAAPVRSRPRRTYDPMLLSQDGWGEYVPSYLAQLSRQDADAWQKLRGNLEEFGKSSSLFDEINVRSFGRSDGDPFQIQVRTHGRRRKGPWRNLIDVGYGVSQVLPLLTELLKTEGPILYLLQQPEVHLHPQAQAALGTLFCQVASGGRQLVVETHSDYIIDRVRMDVRDQTTGLKPEDVSVLYFEQGDLNVKIHSIRIDQAGNVLGAPRSYGDFFMDEVSRSIGLRKN